MIRLLYLRAVCLAVAAFALYTVSASDFVGAQTTSVQQVEIGELQRRAGENDVLTQRIEAEQSKQADEIAEIEGEERVFFSVITLLTGGSFVGQIVVQVADTQRRKKNG